MEIVMKKGAYGVVSLFFVACLTLFLFKTNFLKSFEKDLNIAKKSETVSKEREFVVVVPSFNNDAYFERNLDSIFSQEYKNYRVIYIEDFSTDNTYANVKDYIERKGVQDVVTLIQNQENRKALYNLYTAVHSCSNDQIVVLLDGDDWFAHPYVLRDLNHYYEDENVWMTYGQYMRHPDNQMGMCAPVTKKFLHNAEMRANKWQYSHLRTFYAGLFKRVKLQDLIENGKFLSVAWDLAIMLPMMEMAREHAYFTPDVFYVYNYETPLNDAKIRLMEQERVEKYVRSLPIYPTLKVDPRKPFGEKDQADLVVFSYNRPMQLYAFLESVTQNVSRFRKIAAIYREDASFAEGYELVKKTFPEVSFFKQSKENPRGDFKPLVLETVLGKFGEGANYVAFAVDDIIITDKIHIHKDIVKLQETGAYGVFYRLGKHVDYCYMMDMHQGVPDLLEVGEGCLAWQFKSGKGDWIYPNSVDLVLYAKSDIRKDLERLKFTFPNDFEGEWSKYSDKNKIGLCHERAQMVNIPMNIVSTFNNRAAHTFSPEALNEMFLQGLKIDIEPFYHVLNRGAHADISPQFVARDQIVFVNNK